VIRALDKETGAILWEAPLPADRGALRGRRVVGMRILDGFRREDGKWVGGRILDPDSGREYRSSIWLDEEGRLKVRGYWGPFRRTQRWRRLDEGVDRGRPHD
jgi:uncharacterized protein (DUF2147 family)